MFRWCGWCCNLRPELCCQCNLCPDCCRCPPPPFPYLCPPPPCLPPLPSLGRGPPPIRVIHEKVLVPVPYPVYPDVQIIPCQLASASSSPCGSPCDYNNGDCQEAAGYSPRNRRRHQNRQSCWRPATPSWPPYLHSCRNKKIHKAGRAIVPGYTGHVPGFKGHGAGRSYGSATKDTCCIISHWKECIPELPCRIFEQ